MEAHVVFPGDNPREVRNPPFNLVVRKHVRVREGPLSNRLSLRVRPLGLSVIQRRDIEVDGKPEIWVIVSVLNFIPFLNHFHTQLLPTFLTHTPFLSYLFPLITNSHVTKEQRQRHRWYYTQH